jgi:enoyl-CoA hydratase/carnithine racemase
MKTTSTDLDIAAIEGVAKLTLNRPDRRNALSESLLEELGAALDQIAHDSSVRVVVIGAEGPVFSSGHDLSEMIGRSPEEYARIFARCSLVMQKLRALPQPVIARVQGHALAAGCQLVAACDLAVSVPEATFSTPGVKIGLFCTTPMVPLVRAIPQKASMEMLLTGKPISAQRALELGLLNRVVDREQLDEAINEFADSIIASSPTVIRLGKAAFYKGLALDEPSAYECATRTMTENAQLPDAQEGISAFLQKRRPEWTNDA